MPGKRQVAEEQHQVALTINNLQSKLISNHYLLYLMAKYSSTLTCESVSLSLRRALA